MNIRHAVKAVMKAITAAVIAILNVNMRFCPLAHGRSLPRARPQDRKRRDSEPRAARLAFERADFGQISAPRAGQETEPRNITKFCGRWPRAGYAISAEIPGGSLIGRKGRQPIPDRPKKPPCSAAEILWSLS